MACNYLQNPTKGKKSIFIFLENTSHFYKEKFT